MLKFLSAVLWIEKDILGLDKNVDIVKTNEKAGKLVLREMLKGGNFGHQYAHHHANIIVTYAKQMLYRIRFVSEFPSEPILRPFALTWDYVKKHWLSVLMMEELYKIDFFLDKGVVLSIRILLYYKFVISSLLWKCENSNYELSSH